MLITKESSSRLAAQQQLSTANLANQVSSVLRELQAARSEVRQLLDQRRQLEVYLIGLRGELERLRAEKVELLAQRSVPAPVGARPAGSAHVDLVAQRSGDQDRRRRGSVAEEEAITPRSDTDEDAFRAFLLADVDHDKSRAWFMSNSG